VLWTELGTPGVMGDCGVCSASVGLRYTCVVALPWTRFLWCCDTMGIYFRFTEVLGRAVGRGTCTGSLSKVPGSCRVIGTQKLPLRHCL